MTENTLTQETIHKAYYQLMSSFDTPHGGFGLRQNSLAPHAFILMLITNGLGRKMRSMQSRKR
ncbi:hypothetical protein ACEQPO_00885 [Bacillus sp. SL00103]